MDATRLSISIFVLSLTIFTMACGNQNPSSVKSSTLNGQSCAPQVKKNSFLVEWAGEIPKEYESLRLHPGSKITRFKNIEKNDLENNVLKKNLGKFLSAEHEFYVRSIIEPTDLMAKSTVCTSTTNSWGPSDIQAQQAWALTGKKGDGVIVGVVDSGVDVNHTLLSSQVVAGWDFTTNTSDVTDGAGHGTHVAGIIAGQSGAFNFTGVAPNAKIMPLKFIDDSGSGTVGDAISAMEYASSHGVKIINASWGGNECSDLMKQEIQTTISHGTVFINASGNAGHDINDPAYSEWPAVFQLPGKITVGAMNSGQKLSVFSNYGILVDLAAPGEKIISSIPNLGGQPDNILCDKSGTSMATPFVAGVAALLLSNKPNLSPMDIANAINSSVVVGGYGVRTSGKLNALRAVQAVLP